MSNRLRLVFLSLLIPIFAWGQAPAPPNTFASASSGAKSSGTPTPSAMPSPSPNLSPSAPVISIAGICANGATPSAHCTTTVTRREFEDLVGIVQPQMTPAQRQRLAVLYSQLLVFADAAQREGLDRSADGQEALHFAQLQALTQVLTRKLQAETSKVGAEEVQKYYREHPKEFEEGALERLYIPREAKAAGKPVKEEDVQAEMVKLRTRAVAGESFDSLQKQAYADLGLSGNPPATQLQKVRRGGLSSNLAAVFDLQLGVVSQVISEANGLYVFRLNSKRELTAPEAAPEITRTLQAQRLQQALQQITAAAKATFDHTYFGVEPKASSADSGAAPTNSLGGSENDHSTVAATKSPTTAIRAEGTPR